MGEPKFTPGPWVIIPAREYEGDDDSLIGCFVSPAGIEGDDGNPVCVFGTCEGSGTLFENEADYHLISAAPALYAVAERALAFVNALPVPTDGAAALGIALNTALSQALGEPTQPPSNRSED